MFHSILLSLSPSNTRYCKEVRRSNLEFLKHTLHSTRLLRFTRNGGNGRYIIILLFPLFASLNSSAQELSPRGQFLVDSISIGVPVPFALSLRYARELDIVFPDSLFDYSPYELDHKVYFPTRSDSTHSYDSTIYYLTSFEIDTIQRLKLPVYITHGRDCTAVYTATDSVILKQLVTEIPDSVTAETLPLKENTAYRNVPLAFNYPYLLIGLGILLALGGGSFVLFGKKVRRNWRLKRLRKAHEHFLAKYDRLTNVEEVLVHWKKYLESLLQQPYTKLTTKEIMAAYEHQEIEAALKAMDRAIYGSQSTEEAKAGYQALRDFVQAQYEQVVEEIINPAITPTSPPASEKPEETSPQRERTTRKEENHG